MPAYALPCADQYGSSGVAVCAFSAPRILTLVTAGEARDPRCEAAARFLVTTQLDNGDWPRQSLSGVFNKTALINYENYRRYFPIWALARFAAAVQ